MRVRQYEGNSFTPHSPPRGKWAAKIYLPFAWKPNNTHITKQNNQSNILWRGLTRLVGGVGPPK